MKFDKSSIDILKEIGNIGAGNASTSLSQLLEGDVGVSVPDCEILPFDEVSNLMGGPEALVVAVLVQINGDIDGVVMLILKAVDALLLSQRITGDELSPSLLQDIEFLHEKLKPIEEIGNILIGTYISSVSKVLNLTIIPTVPMMAIDMAQAIMSVPLSLFGDISDEALLMTTKFSSNIRRINGHFLMIPTVESHQRIVSIIKNG